QGVVLGQLERSLDLAIDDVTIDTARQAIDLQWHHSLKRNQRLSACDATIVWYHADSINGDFKPVIFQALVYSANHQTPIGQVPTDFQKYLNGKTVCDPDFHTIIRFKEVNRAPRFGYFRNVEFLQSPAIATGIKYKYA